MLVFADDAVIPAELLEVLDCMRRRNNWEFQFSVAGPRHRCLRGSRMKFWNVLIRVARTAISSKISQTLVV